MNYFAAWYVLALVAVLFFGFETRGRTIDEIDGRAHREEAGGGAGQGARGLNAFLDPISGSW
jgi:hypothetical protein